MKKQSFQSMTVDELWRLYEELSQVLSVRLASEKRQLEKRLTQLQREKKTLARVFTLLNKKEAEAKSAQA